MPDIIGRGRKALTGSIYPGATRRKAMEIGREYGQAVKVHGKSSTRSFFSANEKYSRYLKKKPRHRRGIKRSKLGLTRLSLRR